MIMNFSGSPVQTSLLLNSDSPLVVWLRQIGECVLHVELSETRLNLSFRHFHYLNSIWLVLLLRTWLTIVRIKLNLIFPYLSFLREMCCLCKLLLTLIVLTSRCVLVAGKYFIVQQHHGNGRVLQIKWVVVKLNRFLSIIVCSIMLVFGRFFTFFFSFDDHIIFLLDVLFEHTWRLVRFYWSLRMTFF
jgi:hypothetical protein